jgi:hypothetical protein
MNRDYAITSLLEVLDAILREASQYTTEALHAIQSGERNQAIGTLLYIEKTLPTASALYEATFALHRCLPPKGGAN